MTNSPSSRGWLQRPFAIVPTVVIIDPNLSHGAIRLYTVLCQAAGGTDSTDITIEELSVLLRVSERTVARKFAELAERGLVISKGQGAKKPSLKVLTDPAEIYSQSEIEQSYFPRPAPGAVQDRTVSPYKKGVREETSLREVETSYEVSHTGRARVEEGAEEPPINSITHEGVTHLVAPIDPSEGAVTITSSTPDGVSPAWTTIGDSLPNGGYVRLDAEGRVPEALDDWLDEPEPKKPEEDPNSPWGRKKAERKEKKRRRGGRSASGRENCLDLAALFKEEFKLRWPDEFSPDCIDGKLLTGFKRLIDGFTFERAFHLCRVVIWSWEAMREIFKLRQPRPIPWHVYQFRNEIAGVASTGFTSPNFRRNKIMDEKCGSVHSEDYGKVDPLWGVTA